MTEDLKDYIQSYFGITLQEAEVVSHYFRPLKLEKGSLFLKKEQQSLRLGFVRSGLLREFFSNGDKEVTKWISDPGYFVVDLASFFFDTPARWNIEALTDCELQVLSKEDYRTINQVVPKWSQLEKQFLARCFTVLEDRVVNHLSLSAEERYNALFAYKPSFFQHVPQQYLASLLGMTAETFSRIRKKQSEHGS